MNCELDNQFTGNNKWIYKYLPGVSNFYFSLFESHLYPNH